ncbi:MAG TPA: acyl carrier protein [Pseudonocardiaceae bacterium]|jgi:acyl carrier protein|nr:acyl carrier protein [Pseudonocardiaceae bacterium]
MNPPTTPTDITDITRTVADIAAGEIGGGVQLAADTDLRAVQGVDSVKMLRMIAKIERAFDVELEDEDVFGISTVGGAAALVEQALRERV